MMRLSGVPDSIEPGPTPQMRVNRCCLPKYIRWRYFTKLKVLSTRYQNWYFPLTTKYSRKHLTTQNMLISEQAYVIKGESFSFAYGGCADVWKGKWKDGTENQMVRTSLIVGLAPTDLTIINLVGSKGPKRYHSWQTGQGNFIVIPRWPHSCIPTNQRLIQEGQVWSLVAHPNITPFLGLCFDFHRPGLPSLVSPFYQHGDITRYLGKNPNINRLPLVSHIPRIR